MRSLLVMTFVLVAGCQRAAPVEPNGRVEKRIEPEGYAVEHTEGVSAHVALFRNAALRFDAGDLAGARALYEEARRLEPSSAEPLVGLGSCELHQGHFAEARKRFAEALALDARSTLARIGMGSALYRERRFAEAAAAYDAAVGLDDANADAHWGAATAYVAVGKSDIASRHAQRFLELAPRSALAPRARAIASGH
jgi:tetratricopeptide (TPR) repeat protein